MKVYEIDSLAKPGDRRFKEYAWLVAEDEVWDRIMPDGEAFNGVPFGKWKTQKFYYEQPLAPKSNFVHLCASAFVCDEKAREIAGGPMEMSGEFLPIRVEGGKGKFWIYNITNTINVLDLKRSRWEKLGPRPDDRALQKPAFISSRFGEETIFKIAEDRGTGMYCVEFSGDADDGEFKTIVEQSGLTGLTFKLVWTDKK